MIPDNIPAQKIDLRKKNEPRLLQSFEMDKKFFLPSVVRKFVWKKLSNLDSRSRTPLWTLCFTSQRCFVREYWISKQIWTTWEEGEVSLKIITLENQIIFNDKINMKQK